METCSKDCNDLDINSSPPRSCLDASVDVEDTSSDDDEHSETRCNESPGQTSGDFAALSNLSGLHRNDDSGVETSMGESPKGEDQIVDAICRRTRAHFSLTDMSLDELETFLQESDEEDYFQNVDDEEEYRKFVAAVQGGWKEGLGTDELVGSKRQEEEDDDEDEDEEDDYDFEIELEEALESDYEDLPKQEIATRKRRCRAAVLGRMLKKRTPTERPLSSARTPLRPLLPSGASKDPSCEPNKHFKEALHGSTEAVGFTPCQRRQLQCLMHEHVQLLVQVFSVTVLDPACQQIAADTHKLLLQLADAREQVLTWKRPFRPEVCCCLYNVHASTSSSMQQPVDLGLLRPHHPSQVITKQTPKREASSLGKDVEDNNAMSETQTSLYLRKEPCAEANQCSSTPSTTKVSSMLDIPPLALVKDFLADIARGVQEFRQQRLQVSDGMDKGQEPLFLARFIQVSPAQTCQRKKTMAGSLVEDTKLNGIVLVPSAIAAAARRFTALFDSSMFPHKPPPAALAKRLLFTEAEDELLAMGLMRYNTNWDTIQQLLLPSKTTHQIFVRQKNRSTARAPENSIKAVRRLKTSPLTKEEESCIEEGLKVFKSDWLKVWEHCVPYRDPTTLSRLWRAASGLQKSYSANEEAKEKRRIGEKLRRQKQALLKEQNSANGELNSGEETCEETTGAYFHEAFLADYNAQPCTSPAPLSADARTSCQASADVQSSLTLVPNLPMLTTPYPAAVKSNYMYYAPSAGTCEMPLKTSRRGGKRHRRGNFQIIKLAPGLPSLNLPRCVRVISQAKYNSQFSATNNPLTPAPQCSLRSPNGGFVGLAGGQACSSVLASVPNQSYFAGPSDSLRGEKALPARMHPLLMQTTFETGPLSSSTSNKLLAHPGLPSMQSIPHFRPFLPGAKGKSLLGSKEVSAARAESSTRGAAELHPFLQEDGENQTSSRIAAKDVMRPKGSMFEGSQGTAANTGTSQVGNAHWPFFLSDSVIRPEPRRAVRPQDLQENCSAIVSHGRNSHITNVEMEVESSEENIVMEQEELSGSEEEMEEGVQFEYEEMTDSDNDESHCEKNAAQLHKAEEGIQFEEEEIGSDDGDSEVGM